MFPFKTIMYAVAMVIIKQTVCIATALIMWEMWILPEKEAFWKKKKKKKKKKTIYKSMH